MNILVTGITGLLGKSLAQRLSTMEGAKIYGIARTVRGEIPNVNYIYGEIQNPRTYQQAPQKIDICIHAAAAIPLAEDLHGQEACIATNIKGTHELVKFLVNKYSQVYLSTISTLSTLYTYKPFDDEVKTEESAINPGTFYGLSKLYSEAIVLRSGLRASVIRLASFYDSKGEARLHQRLLYDWIDRAQNGQDLVVLGTGQERRNYLHVDDAVEAVFQCIEQRATGIYNIASDQTLTTYEIAQTISDLTGGKSRIIMDSQKTVYAPISGISIEKARRELNFQPKITLSLGFQRIIKYANS